MKTLHLFYVLLFLISSSLVAQDFNAAYQPFFYSFANRVIPVSENRFLIGGQTGTFMGYPSFAPYLLMVNANGQELWDDRIQDVGGTELGEILDMKMNEAGDIFVAGTVMGCDYFIPGFVAQYDSLGNKIWLEEFWDVFRISLLPEASMAVLSRSGLLQRIDQVEGEIWEVNLSGNGQFFSSQDMTFGPNQSIYVLGDTKLLKIDLEGEIVQQKNVVGGGTLFAEPGSDYLWLLTPDKLEKLDAQLNTIDEIDLSGEGTFNRLAIKGSLIFALGKTNNQRPLVVKLTEDLQIETSFSVLDAHFIPYDFQIVNDHLIFTGDELVDPYTSSQEVDYYNRTLAHRGSNLFLYSTDFMGNANLTDDAAVTALSYQNISLDTLGYCDFSQGDAAGTVTWEDIKISIQNQGTSTLETVTLNTSFIPCAFICATRATATRKFDNLNLAPGASMVLNWGSLQVGGMTFSELSDLCFWTSLPNGHIDGNHINNISCADITIDTREVIANTAELTLYPNPARDILTVQYEGQSHALLDYRVLNAVGQVVLSGVWQKGESSLSIPITSLPSGVYTLQANSASQILVSQFVVLAD